MVLPGVIPIAAVICWLTWGSLGTDWSKVATLTCWAIAACGWQGVSLHGTVHPGGGQPGLPDMAASYCKKGDKRLRLGSHTELLLHILLVKEVTRFRFKEVEPGLWMGGVREAHCKGRTRGNARDH